MFNCISFQVFDQLLYTTYLMSFFSFLDPRVSDWPMMQSPVPTLIICLSYVYVVKYLGPSLMKNREPLDIRWIMASYNFAMVLFNSLIFYHVSYFYLRETISLKLVLLNLSAFYKLFNMYCPLHKDIILFCKY